MSETGLITDIANLQARVDMALRQVNRREMVDLTNLDQQAEGLCLRAEKTDYEEAEKTEIMRLLGHLIRSLDDLEREMNHIITSAKNQEG